MENANVIQAAAPAQGAPGPGKEIFSVKDVTRGFDRNQS